MPVTLVLPAHNQESTIQSVVLDLLESIPKCEIIVVCNGCFDDTAKVVRQLNHPNVLCLELVEARKGLAIIEGMKHAKFGNVGFVDTDGAFSGKDAGRLLSRLDEHDCLIASKWKGVSFTEVNEPFARKVMSRIWNLLVRWLLDFPFQDTQAGLKVFKKSAYDSINHDFICKGFDFDVELLLKFKRSGYKITEELVPVRKSTRTSFRLRHVPGMAFNLLRLALRRT